MSRDSARQEAAFRKGAVGVDGQATEEKVDVAELERGKAREQFLRGRSYLGRELLTWLLWRSEAAEPIANIDGTPLSVVFTGRIVLRGIAGDATEVVAKGVGAPYASLVRQALAQGLLVHNGRVQLTHGEKTYEVSLDAEFLDVRSAKLPEVLAEADEERLLERLFLVEQLSNLLDALVKDFLTMRSGRKWSREIVPAMKAWMREGGAAPRRKTG